MVKNLKFILVIILLPVLSNMLNTQSRKNNILSYPI